MTSSEETDSQKEVIQQAHTKPVVYQVFTRLFGNTNTTNKPWGTIEDNGVGKFSDFTDDALKGIKELGVSHIWYTGVPHHAVINDYTAYGISNDDPDVVKGRAGSPYAVKDYYNVNPDLADNPARRLEEFEALIARTHKNGMKVLIDIVPNHVARNYKSLSMPDHIENFGASDNTKVEYARDNNFYYIVGEAFSVPEGENGYQPLGGEAHPLADGEFDEYPAKWTGNGARKAQPHANDWYETVKVNYGVRPDGSYDFPSLPDGFDKLGYEEHHAFWADVDVPDSWLKFNDIVHYWLDKGVDGFRYDMAEMVPVEFWSYLNSSIKMKNPDAFLLAEVYQPHLYRDYLHLGKMDYLYDKVEFYDSLKRVMQGEGDTAQLHTIQQGLADIEHHMLHFLENHDEQRIASPDFAGDAVMGKPGLVASALVNRAPMMLYFGQDVGEDGSEEMGFGDPTRTSIFDYAGVPAHQRWMNNGKFDGGQLTEQERQLRAYYKQVMQIAAFHPTMQGNYTKIDAPANVFAFARYTDNSVLIVASSFSRDDVLELSFSLPESIVSALPANSQWTILLGGSEPSNTSTQSFSVEAGEDDSGIILNTRLQPLGSVVLELAL
ncbi:alpha-amylase family protein [Alteromonas sediminis]|nr:alpha-amylase family protein [Alteromonas sediminis]